jgi:hypothetical protein
VAASGLALRHRNAGVTLPNTATRLETAIRQDAVCKALTGVGNIISLGNLSYTFVAVIGNDFLADVQADLWPHVRSEFVRAVAGRWPQ